MKVSRSEQINELAAALAKAQGQFPKVRKSKTANVKHKNGGGEHSYSYADLADVLEAVRKPLSETGLALLQLIEPAERHLFLRTQLLHTSGQFLDSVYPLPAGLDAQGMGSAITYARRYTISAMLGIAAEDDDDGQGANDRRPEQDNRRQRDNGRQGSSTPPKPKDQQGPKPAAPATVKQQIAAMLSAGKDKGWTLDFVQTVMHRAWGIEKSDALLPQQLKQLDGMVRGGKPEAVLAELAEHGAPVDPGPAPEETLKPVPIPGSFESAPTGPLTGAAL